VTDKSIAEMVTIIGAGIGGLYVAAMAQGRAFTLSSPAACPPAVAAIPHAPQSIPLLSG
jgi:hypothetical protein